MQWPKDSAIPLSSTILKTKKLMTILPNPVPPEELSESPLSQPPDWEDIEKKAEELEVTVDYYLMEFT